MRIDPRNAAAPLADMLNTRFNARRGYRWVARLSICFLLIATAVLPGCKSWGKFWAIYTPGEAKPLYSGAALWNDYIAADGTARPLSYLNQSTRYEQDTHETRFT